MSLMRRSFVLLLSAFLNYALIHFPSFVYCVNWLVNLFVYLNLLVYINIWLWFFYSISNSFAHLLCSLRLKGISHSLELPQDLQAERWSETTTPFLPLLRGLLQQSPHARITAHEVVESEWLAQWKNGKRALDGEENGESVKRVKMDDELNFITNKVGLF